jgi:hypothetical protein
MNTGMEIRPSLLQQPCILFSIGTFSNRLNLVKKKPFFCNGLFYHFNLTFHGEALSFLLKGNINSDSSANA